MSAWSYLLLKEVCVQTASSNRWLSEMDAACFFYGSIFASHAVICSLT
jgi:hypothetical protein